MALRIFVEHQDIVDALTLQAKSRAQARLTAADDDDIMDVGLRLDPARPAVDDMTQIERIEVVTDARVQRIQALIQFIFETKPHDLADFAERGLNLGRAIIAEPLFHRRQDAGLAAGQAHGDDKRKAEALGIGRVKRVKAGEFVLTQGVKPGRGLFRRRLFRQAFGDRRFVGQLRVGAQQRQFRIVAQAIDYLHQGGVHIGRTGKGTPAGGSRDDAGRVLEQKAETANKIVARQLVHEVAPSSETCADTTFQPSEKCTQA